MAAEQVTYNCPDGAVIGNSSTEKIGFFGATTVTQPAQTLTTVDISTITTQAVSALTTTQAQALQTNVNGLINLVKTLGLNA